MTAPTIQQSAADREEQFLALLRAGAGAAEPGHGLFDTEVRESAGVLLQTFAATELRAGAAGADAPPLAVSWRAVNALWRLLWSAWRFTRQLSGDDAYERYMQHMARAHPGQMPLSRAQHYALRQDEKWNRLSRCC
jgi:uncharacterized short protein YbdD (DUF466 family)